MRILGMRLWDLTSMSRKLKLFGYRKLLGMETCASIHSNVMIFAHHSGLGGVNSVVEKNVCLMIMLILT